MIPEIRVASEDDLRALLELDAAAFGWGPVEDKHVEYDRPIFEPERALIATEGGRAIGSAAAFSFALTVPGGAAVPVAAVSMVSVRPTHRRRGVLTGLMRRQLEDVHQRDEPLAILYASEASIYGRFGYGPAVWEARLEIDRFRTAFSRRAAGGERLDLVSASEARDAIAAVWDRARATRPGMVGMGGGWLDHFLGDPEWHREGWSELRHVLHGGTSVDGYVSYRVKPDWAGTAPDGRLRVEQLVATTTEAYQSLWAFCFGVDLVSTITADRRPVEEPIRLLLADAEALRTEIHTGVWLRLIDIAGALAARRYGADGGLVLSVVDPFCTWNQGVFELQVADGDARCASSKAGPELGIDAAALGAAYLGGTSFRALAVAGRVEELRPGALDRADAMFASRQVPWCPVDF
ncbi:MAG: GNAT family N-acetyltransferase [Candidatus Dormibacteraceae bacterium]